MTDILDLSEKLQDTSAAIAAMEAVYLRTNESAIQETLRTLERRRSDLEARLSAATDAQEIEVCRYRIIKTDGAFPISVLADSLRAFQGWLTVTFDAIKNGPKTRSRVSVEIAHQSTLEFGYAYQGSVGFVLTIPNERLLIGETDLDLTVNEMFEILRSTSSSELREHSRKVGLASIRRMHEWINAHAKAEVSADIRWSRGETIKSDILFQAEEAARLASIVEATSDQTAEKMTVTGFLQGADLDARTFHLSFPEAEGTEDVHGYMAKTFTAPLELPLGRRYEADLVKYTVSYYAMDKDDVRWDLMALRPNTR